MWLPASGLGLALVAWLGLGLAPVLALDLFLVRFFLRDQVVARALTDSCLLAGESALAWWAYHRLAGGSGRLQDPRSATIFLLIVPGALAAAMACVQALSWAWMAGITHNFWSVAGALWMSRALGILALAPPLLVVATPFLVRARFVPPEPPAKLPGGTEPEDWTLGEAIETLGLCLGTAILAVVLVLLHVGQGPGWTLWGVSLLLVVWSALRQGLRGGSLAAAASAVLALVVASVHQVTAAEFSPLQGNLLAQCSTALLVGASAGWIRASEARYRQLVGHIPVVLYSARLPREVRVAPPHSHGARPESRQIEQLILQQAEVTLVSSASVQIFGCPPDDLLGSFADWLQRVEPADREILTAAIVQLALQRQPVSCEYRLASARPVWAPRAPGLLETPFAASAAGRWVRDTLVPQYTSDGSLKGWEGVIEDITEQRSLSQNLRRTGNMLQALITYLPTGVFFVHGPMGLPLLVNQRARQLLGQREDLAAGIEHLAHVYRLRRPDGSEYPVDELPVTKALRHGITSMANDIVVHRPDGRKVPLITWAAPVDLTGRGNADAAVWVLEDMTALQQAESARRESEARLRAVIETMAEGLLLQNQEGAIVECNPAASTILGVPRDALLGRIGLAGEGTCLGEDGAPLPRDRHPDSIALRSGVAVRNVVMGVRTGNSPGEKETRWILVNTMPLPGTLASSSKGARVVTTFADITTQRHALEELRRAQQLELVGKLASGTIHDFNNLLTVMMALAGLIEHALPAAHPAQGDLQRLMEAGEQASHLAGQLLAFGKQGTKDARTADVNTAVVHSLRLLKGTFPPEIEVEQRLSSEDLLVHADENQLKQVVMNLCLNARDAMTRGGQLTVSTERVHPEGNRNGVGWVRLSVQDTGQGMDEAVQARIFEPFFSTKERGTGLGLAVVRQIVESFGGRIQVYSRPQHGTRMDVWLKSCAGEAAD